MIKRYLLFVFASISLVFSCNPVETPSDFEVYEEFRMELVAVEPLITDPVDLEFDEFGRIFVLEMPGYPMEDVASRIVLLSDENGDGIMDKRTVYANDLQMATSLMPFQGGILVAAPPYLLWVSDEDQDGEADRRDTLMGGFSTGNLQHNYNGLTLGPDGWIYAANGGNSGQPFWWGDYDSKIDLKGNDMRFHLEKRKMEILGESSGGFEWAFDEWGHIFETHNLEHISNLVFPSRYSAGVLLEPSHTLINISDHEENGLSRIYPIGEQETRVNHPEQSGYFSGACGITYYGGGAYGEEFEQTVWVADVVLNLIHVDKIQPTGTAFTASRLLDGREVIASGNRSFRPVNMSVGPDGYIYVVDMYREVIEHPEWIPDELESELNLDSGKDKGRIYKLYPLKSKPKMPMLPGNQSPVQWIEQLSHPNQWVRMTCHRLLLDKTFEEEIIDLLRREALEGHPLARYHGLHLLAAKGLLKQNEILNNLKSENPNVRRVAALLSESINDKGDTLLYKLAALITDESPEVRMQSALSLSTFNPEELGDNQEFLIQQLVSASKMENDVWNEQAMIILSRHFPLEFLMELLEIQDSSPSLIGGVAAMCGRDTLVFTKALENLADRITNHQINVIKGLARGITAQSSDIMSLNNTVEKIESKANLSVLIAMGGLRKRLSLPVSSQLIKRFEELNVKWKAAAFEITMEDIELLDLIPYHEKADLLFSALEVKYPQTIQNEVLRQLSRYEEVEIGRRLVDGWNAMTPQTRKFAGDILLYRYVHHPVLMDALESGTIKVGEMNFDLERRRTLLWWTDDERIRDRAAHLFNDAAVVTRSEAIKSMEEALTLIGNAQRGSELFIDYCSSCHRFGDVGKAVGPVLTEISRKSKETLLHEIIDPNANVDTRYINHKVTTNDGSVYYGIIDADTPAYLRVIQQTGEPVEIPRVEITSFSSLGQSLMMEGFEALLSPQEMADLLTYLQISVD